MTISENEIHADYQHRMNRVFRYIDENLNANLSLDLISKIAFFSPFHFHRVFKFITGETLNAYIARQRVEKAALNLMHTNIGITEISLNYGFNSNSSFTRTFKKYYGVSPTEFRKQNPNKFSKIRQLKSKNGQDYPDYEKYICIINHLKKWIEMNAKIEIRNTPKLEAASITHIGVNRIETAFEKLIKWGNSKGLLKNSEEKLGRIFYDSFKVTTPDKIRMSIFLTSNKPFDAEGEIEKITINNKKCIVGHFEITSNEFEKSWSGLFIWMNENGYKKANGNPFEIYHNDYKEHPENKFIVDLYIPIE